MHNRPLKSLKAKSTLKRIIFHHIYIVRNQIFSHQRAVANQVSSKLNITQSELEITFKCKYIFINIAKTIYSNLLNLLQMILVISKISAV